MIPGVIAVLTIILFTQIYAFRRYGLDEDLWILCVDIALLILMICIARVVYG